MARVFQEAAGRERLAKTPIATVFSHTYQTMWHIAYLSCRTSTCVVALKDSQFYSFQVARRVKQVPSVKRKEVRDSSIHIGLNDKDSVPYKDNLIGTTTASLMAQS